MKKAFTLILLVQSYFLLAQNWEQVQSVPDNYRTDHSFAFSIDGTGYMVSGNTSAGASDDFYTYDATADQWSKKDDFPGAPRGFAIGDVIDGKAYFGFGSTGNVSLNDFWQYDPVTDMWTELASCDCIPRTHPAMVAFDGFIYVGLGGSAVGNRNDWWAYDIENDSWQQKEDFPAAERHHPYQFHDDEYVYVGNGHGNGFISNEWYRYDTAEDTWEQIATIPAEGRVAGTQLSHEGFGYVLSGDGDNHAFMDTGELWKYDPELNIWIQLPPHPGRSRWAPASFIIDDEMYIINGWNGADGFLDPVYKLGLDVFSEARLRVIMPSEDELIFISNDQDCDAFAETQIEVNTPIEFIEDATITLSVDAASTAVEGRDYSISELAGVLTAGALSTSFGLTVYNDKIASGDKTLIVNLESNLTVESSQASLLISEDDTAFDTSVSNGSAVVGTPNTNNPNIFGQFYTNMITQSIYQRSILEEYGLGAGDISQISMVLEAKGSADPYRNFTVYMANTNVDALNGGINQALGFQQVYQGTFSTNIGINEIIFDTPFAYDGTSNLAIQFCFDNLSYTQDDLVSAFTADYNSTATLKIDNITGCPNTGNQFNTTSLPVITFGKGQAANLFASIDDVITSTISSNEDAYLAQNDSILLNLSAANGNEAECFSASLLSNTNEVLNANGTVWQERIFFLENENADNGYTATLILPNTGDIDWSSSELTGLYTETKLATGDTPVWETLEITSVIENEPYVFVTMNYNGSGSYAVGGSDAVTSTVDLDADITFDEIQYFDIMGRRVNFVEGVTSNNITGIYVKSYLNKGEIVKTEKVLK